LRRKKKERERLKEEYVSKILDEIGKKENGKHKKKKKGKKKKEESSSDE
jgi:hypothetical protein